MDVVSCTREDKTLSKVIELCRNGWPSRVKNFNPKPYFSRKNELSLENDCLLWGQKVVIPYQLRNEVLQLLHDQHIGVMRMKMLARSTVWWPGIDDDIEAMVKSCFVCQRFQPQQSTIPVPWPSTTRVFQHVHIDFLQKFNRYFFILLDSYSRWIEVEPISSTSAELTIAILRKIFSVFGLPEEIVSDNGPPFNSLKYHNFGLNNGIKITLTPPVHPCSNVPSRKTSRYREESFG